MGRKNNPQERSVFCGLVELQFHFPQDDFASSEGFLDEVHVVMVEGAVLGPEKDNLADLTLDDELGTPKAGKFGRVEDGSGGRGDPSSENAVVLGVDATAAEHLGPHFGAVVADLATSVIAVDGAHGSAVIASADDVAVLDDDRAHRLLEAGRPFLQHQADAKEVFVHRWPELPDDVLVVLLLKKGLLLTS